jgi:hypothetical protein
MSSASQQRIAYSANGRVPQRCFGIAHSCRQSGSRLFPVPGQESAELVDRMALGHAVDHVTEIALWIEPVELGRLQYGVEDRSTLAARLGAEESRVVSQFEV